MKKITYLFFYLGIISLIFSFLPLTKIYADPPDELDYHETFIRAKVLQIISSQIQSVDHEKSFTQVFRVQLEEGQLKGKQITISFANDASFGVIEKINVGDEVVVDSKPDSSGSFYYTFYEPYRLKTFLWIAIIFLAGSLIVIGKKGIGAIIGLSISLLVIIYYIIPNILQGHDPLLICVTGCFLILLSSTFIAHGVNLKTCVAVIATSVSLLLAVLLSLISVHLMNLVGLGNENIYSLQLVTNHIINPLGLLLGSILIGTLGALNDVTTTQAITIFTMQTEGHIHSFNHLFFKSLTIGREHIISIINTLVLAYAGSSLIIFLFFTFNPAKLPIWLILNNETVMEEIIKTIVGSFALVLAIPITTLIGTFFALHSNKGNYRSK